MTQHVSHRKSDEVHELHVEVERLRIMIEQATTALNSSSAEIERLRAAHDDYVVRANENVCALNREIERMRTLLRAVIPHIRDDIVANEVLFQIGAALEPKP